MKTNTRIKPFADLLDRYNQCFYDRDIESLRAMYVTDGVVPFFDNHLGCDSHNVQNHLDLVSDFFAKGEVVELIRENFQVFTAGNGACLTLILRYATNPTPGVRTTMFLEREDSGWKIRHVHHSNDPNETDVDPNL
ncbi:MAG: nuclear transport factor 2 family protein [Ardenticatenaceae bacterium]|nr:nuclear transport factor 2 family protein [Ardenticatenaceae bacterium]